MLELAEYLCDFGLLEPSLLQEFYFVGLGHGLDAGVFQEAECNLAQFLLASLVVKGEVAGLGYAHIGI